MQALGSSDSLLISKEICTSAVWMPLLFLLCNYGERVTTSYVTLNEQIYEKSWYLCPCEIQRYFIPVLLAAQQPVYLEGFARINCSLETFKRVSCFRTFYEKKYWTKSFVNFLKIVNGGYSYFMMLRRIGWVLFRAIVGVESVICYKHGKCILCTTHILFSTQRALQLIK